MSRLLHTKLVKESRIAAKQNLNKQLDIHKQKIDDVDRNRELHDLIDEQIASSGGVVDHELKVCVHRACVCACMYVCVCVCVCVCAGSSAEALACARRTRYLSLRTTEALLPPANTHVCIGSRGPMHKRTSAQEPIPTPPICGGPKRWPTHHTRC